LNSSNRIAAENAKPAQADQQARPTDGKPVKKSILGQPVEPPTNPPA